MNIKQVERIVLLLISTVTLIICLNLDTLFSLFSGQAMCVEVVSSASLADMIDGKESDGPGGSIRFDSHPIPFDRESNTLFIPQSLAEDHWKGLLSTNKGKLYFKDDEYFQNKNQAIRENHVFKLYHIGYKGYHEYNVIFTGMPVISLFEESSNLENSEEIMYGTVQIWDPYHASTYFLNTDCSFHLRGGTSYGYDKKSYKLELNNQNMPLLGMRRDDDWILNALYDDAGLIHNKISAEVWKEIASSNHVKNDEGFSMEYAELFINNEYRGVYALIERVDKKELSLGKQDILYKCRATRIPEEHNYSNEETDGMLPVFLLKYPKDFTDEDWDPIKNWVNLFLKGNLEAYEAGEDFLNMENAVDANLFCMLIGGADNTRKNNYFIAE